MLSVELHSRQTHQAPEGAGDPHHKRQKQTICPGARCICAITQNTSHLPTGANLPMTSEGVALRLLCNMLAELCADGDGGLAEYFCELVLEYTQQLAMWVAWRPGEQMLLQDRCHVAQDDTRITVRNFLECVRRAQEGVLVAQPSLQLRDGQVAWGDMAFSVCKDAAEAETCKQNGLAQYLVSVCTVAGFGDLMETATNVSDAAGQFLVLRTWGSKVLHDAVCLMHEGRPCDNALPLHEPLLSFYVSYLQLLFPSIPTYIDGWSNAEFLNAPSETLGQWLYTYYRPDEAKKKLCAAVKAIVSATQDTEPQFSPVYCRQMVQPLNVDEVQKVLFQCKDEPTAFWATSPNNNMVALCTDWGEMSEFLEHTAEPKIHFYNVSFLRAR